MNIKLRTNKIIKKNKAIRLAAAKKTIEEVDKKEEIMIAEKREHITKGFVQLGQDVEAIVGSVYRGFIFGGRNSAGR